MQAKRGGSTLDWLADARPGLAAALRESLPELEWIDRDLELDAGRRVDVVGVDAVGRATALILVGDDEEQALLATLDALAWFTRHRGLLAGHFDHPRLDPARSPRAVLIAETYSELLLARLAGLDPGLVQAYELRHVTSQRSARAYLVPARTAHHDAAPEDPTGVRTLLQALEPESAERAEQLLRRLVRADDELELSADGAGLRCTLEGEPLCGLRARRGALQGWVGEGEGEPILGAEDGEAWMERVLRELAQRLSVEPIAEEGEEVEVLGGPDPFDPGVPLLSPEEISAFQDP